MKVPEQNISLNSVKLIQILRLYNKILFTPRPETVLVGLSLDLVLDL